MSNIQFYGAAEVVTGSKHLITTSKGKRILLDCGLFQGHLNNREELNHHFGFTPHDIDYVVLSHAHIDHSGLLPRLVNQGFRGIIFATPATISLCSIMLMDSAHIQTEEAKYANKRRVKHNEPLLEPLYNVLDVEKTLDLMVPVEYEEQITIDKGITLTLTDAGHLLGSAAVHLDITASKGKKTKISYTGDIGRFNDQILRKPQPFRPCDVLITESTYGNRLHPTPPDVEKELLRVIQETCVVNKGKLIIPAFSVDRTQDLIYTLDKFANAGLLPAIKVFVDSPLSVKATAVIRKHEECYNDEFLNYLRNDPDPFGFKNLTYVSEVSESKSINNVKEPCIIISASGMAEAGRIKHHIKNNILNPKNTILMVGYCTPESLGGKLKSGAKEVRIFGEIYPVNARVVNMDYFSAHADYKEILTYLSHQKTTKVKQIFVVHGEPDAQQSLKDKLEAVGYSNVIIPAMGQKFDLL
jgi:metallo-beta-lactamase family protein